MKPARHTCAATGCSRKVGRECLFCLPHWKAVPLHLKLAINATWEQAQREKAPGEKLQRLREYRDARDAAVACLGAVAAPC